MEIILILIFVFVVIPLIRLAAAIWRAQRAAKSYINNFKKQTENYRKANSQQPEPQKKKKKIDPSDGEFVNFEELPSEAEATQSSKTTYVEIEQQVVDVEWEDIK